MALEKKILKNNLSPTWNEKLRYKVNSVVEWNNYFWQNLTGFNSEPGVGEDWKLTNDSDSQTGFNDCTDFSSLEIVGGVNTLMNFTGTYEQNGNLNLLDENLQINPKSLNDLMSLDFVFTAVVPAGTNHYINVYLMVGTDIYRSQTIPLLKDVGADDTISVSWILPVKQSFLDNKGKVFLNSDVTMTIKNKYICASRLGKGNPKEVYQQQHLYSLWKNT